MLLVITLLSLASNDYLLVHLPITLANQSFLNLLYNNYIIHMNNCQVYLQTFFFASKLTVEMETVACLFPPSKVWLITPHCPIILCITTQYRVSHRLLEKYRWFSVSLSQSSQTSALNLYLSSNLLKSVLPSIAPSSYSYLFVR